MEFSSKDIDILIEGLEDLIYRNSAIINDSKIYYIERLRRKLKQEQEKN